ncbi:MAG: alpha/beta fold hydrolase, partial [Burkholderiales bacterium]|nr:alpha/beta fold hydrolase [Burkholderiales bacterium]
RITVLQLVPSMLRMLVVNPQLPECVHLRRLCCGGEVLDAELAQQTLHALPSGAECVNLYGPTETTIQVVFERVSLDDEVVAIGRPIDNTRVYVLDEFLQPQPIGVRGEIYIAGANLAQGYFGRSELTAERFVDDPFSVTPARMYRTGDLGAWRADGRLDCFGRVDRQVKLRGYRIELGEVESMVAQQPGILMAAVVVDRDNANIDQLLCFYTLKPGASLTVAELKQQLAAALPDYMLPNWLIAIDHFPLMPNGKIDNKALLQLRPSGSQLSQAPRDTLEMRLERIWESVLHVSHVGIASNFFELGGHSLLAVRLMAEIEKEFGFRLPLTSLFSAPTIAAQAELLRGESLQMDTVLIPIRSGNPHYSPVVLVHPTGGSVLCYRDLAGGLATERPVIALQDPGLMGESNYTSVEDLATQYLDKIQPLVKDHRYLLAGWSSGGIIAYEMARQALARGYEVAFLCLIDSQVVPPDDAAPSRDRLLRSISRLIAHKAEIACPDLSGLEFDQALQKLLELAREADFVPPHADQKEIEKLFNVFEKNVTVIGRYAAGALPRRTVLMRAMHALPDAIREAAVHYTAEEKDLGWEKLCFVKVRDIAGDHMSMMETPRVAAVVEALDQELKEVERLHNLQRQILLPMLGL